MKAIVTAVATALGIVTAAGQAGSAHAATAFPAGPPGIAVVNPATGADTGSNAYPGLAGRPLHVVTSGTDILLPTTGSEGAVQTAGSLPRGAMDGTAADLQAQSVASFFARQDARTRLAAQHPTGMHRG